MLPWFLEPHRVTKPNHEFSWSLQVHPWPKRKGLPLASSSMSCVTLGPQPGGFPFPSSQWNYSNKPSPTGSVWRVPHPLVTTQIAPTAHAGSLCSWVHGSWHVVFSPIELSLYVTDTLLSISSVQCQMSCVWSSHTIQGRDPSFTHKVKNKKKKEEKWYFSFDFSQKGKKYFKTQFLHTYIWVVCLLVKNLRVFQAWP